MPKIFNEIKKIFKILEKHYKDMQDVEFTVENKKLWILQTRSGKRTAKSSVKIAVDMVKEKDNFKKTSNFKNRSQYFRNSFTSKFR